MDGKEGVYLCDLRDEEIVGSVETPEDTKRLMDDKDTMERML